MTKLEKVWVIKSMYNIAWLVVAFALGIAVMVNGYGLTVKSWTWVVGVPVGFYVLYAMVTLAFYRVADRLEKEAITELKSILGIGNQGEIK